VHRATSHHVAEAAPGSDHFFAHRNIAAAQNFTTEVAAGTLPSLAGRIMIATAASVACGGTGVSRATEAPRASCLNRACRRRSRMKSVPSSSGRMRAAPTSAPGVAPDPAAAPPSLPVIVAASFDRLELRQRARLLGRLLASVGPLALAVVGGGAFAKYATHARWTEIPVSIEDAAHATSDQIHELVRYIEQSNPQLFSHLLEVLARDTATIAALGASIAALTINRLASYREAR
jgi:hypothetical protein